MGSYELMSGGNGSAYAVNNDDVFLYDGNIQSDNGFDDSFWLR